VHNEGCGHLRETQSELADVLAKLGVASRLSVLERGKPVRFER
jgi:hypothetical protein